MIEKLWTFFNSYAKIDIVKYSIRNKNTRDKKNSNKRKILYGVCTISVVICLLLGLELTNKTNFFGDNQSISETEIEPIPTESTTEPSAGDSQGEEQPEKVISGNPKEDSSQTNTPKPTNTTSTKKSVNPVITFASNNSGDSRVFGYVNGVVENTGTCTFSFTGNGTITKKSTGVEDVSKTNCSTTPPNGAGWSVVLSYNSKAASGTSKKVVVN